MNVITGLPRSGSTLLCNILNQNDKFHATTTSILPAILSEITASTCSTLEFKYMLNKNKEETENRLKTALKSFSDSWHSIHNKEIIFDKSRGWVHHTKFLNEIYPESKMIIIVRDLRNVFASIEKQNRKTGLLFDNNQIQEKSIYGTADVLFSPQGLIGHCIQGIQDFFQRNFPAIIIKSVHDVDAVMKEINKHNVLFVKYEQLANNPVLLMKILYAFLEEKEFEHDFKNIINTSDDPDGLYLYKYPHQGSGEIIPTDQQEWRQYMSQDIADLIINKFDWYYQIFGYPTGTK